MITIVKNRPDMTVYVSERDFSLHTWYRLEEYLKGMLNPSEGGAEVWGIGQNYVRQSTLDDLCSDPTLIKRYLECQVIVINVLPKVKTIYDIQWDGD